MMRPVNVSGATLAKWGRGGYSERADRPYVRAWLRPERPDDRPDRPHRRVKIALDRPLPPVASVLMRGFEQVHPGSSTAQSLADRLANQLDGCDCVIIYFRDTSPGLAAWVAGELKAQTSINRAVIVLVPTASTRAAISGEIGRYVRGVAVLAQHLPRPFHARCDGECAVCHQPIRRSQDVVQYLTGTLVHVICPGANETSEAAT